MSFGIAAQHVWRDATASPFINAFLDRRLEEVLAAPLPDKFVLGYHVVDGKNDPALPRCLLETFKRKLPLEELLAACSPSPSISRTYFLQAHLFAGQTEIHGEIGSIEEKAAEFHFNIPCAPPEGSWIATLDGFNSERIFRPHKQRGIARSLLQGAMAVFHRWGLDGVRLSADLEGRYVWPHIGFDFENPETAITLREKFNHRMSPKKMPPFKRAWELADFQEDGIPLGKNFLLSESANRQPTIPLLFRLNHDYAGWGKLFKDLNSL